MRYVHLIFQEDIADPPKSYNILLLGKSGYGKTRTAFSLCREAYTSEDGCETGQGISGASNPQGINCQSTGRSYSAGHFTAGDLTINVIDTPGFLDNSDVDDVKAAENAIENVDNAFSLLKEGEGFNAFVIVYKYGVRYTREEQKTIDRMLLLFGCNNTNEMSKAKFLIIFTYADDFTIDQQDREDVQYEAVGKSQNDDEKTKEQDASDVNFVNWLCRAADQELSNRIKHRFVLFENRRANESTLVSQRDKFVEKLRHLTKQFTREEFRASVEKNKVEFMNLVSYDERKSKLEKDLVDLYNQYSAADVRGDTEELEKIKNQFKDLWENADREVRDELTRELMDVKKVLHKTNRRRSALQVIKSFVLNLIPNPFI